MYIFIMSNSGNRETWEKIWVECGTLATEKFHVRNPTTGNTDDGEDEDLDDIGLLVEEGGFERCYAET